MAQNVKTIRQALDAANRVLSASNDGSSDVLSKDRDIKLAATIINEHKNTDKVVKILDARDHEKYRSIISQLIDRNLGVDNDLFSRVDRKREFLLKSKASAVKIKKKALKGKEPGIAKKQEEIIENVVGSGTRLLPKETIEAEDLRARLAAIKSKLDDIDTKLKLLDRDYLDEIKTLHHNLEIRLNRCSDPTEMLQVERKIEAFEGGMKLLSESLLNEAQRRQQRVFEQTVMIACGLVVAAVGAAISLLGSAALLATGVGSVGVPVTFGIGGALVVAGLGMMGYDYSSSYKPKDVEIDAFRPDNSGHIPVVRADDMEPRDQVDRRLSSDVTSKAEHNKDEDDRPGLR